MFIVPSPMPHFFFCFFEALGKLFPSPAKGFPPTINRVSNTLSKRVVRMKDGGCKGLAVPGTEGVLSQRQL